MVQLVRGVGAAAIVLGTLLAGYVTTTQALGWPGSPIVSATEGEPAVRSFVGTTPAAASEISESVPTGARWELVSLVTQLTTSAVAGTRTPLIVLGNPAAPWGLFPVFQTFGNSVVWTLTWGQAVSAVGQGSSTCEAMSIPVAARLLGGHTIKTITAGMQAGDQYSAPQYVVREWLEVG